MKIIGIATDRDWFYILADNGDILKAPLPLIAGSVQFVQVYGDITPTPIVPIEPPIVVIPPVVSPPIVVVPPDVSLITKIGVVGVYGIGNARIALSHLFIDADGSPRAYGPGGKE